MKNLSLFCLYMLLSLGLFSQTEKAIFELYDSSDLDVRAKSNGSFESIDISIDNFSNKSYNVIVPLGTFLINRDTTEQNLVVVFYDNIAVKPNSKSSEILGVACADAGKKVPKKNRTTWDFGYDDSIGLLLEFYFDNQMMIALATGNDHHETQLKRHRFLQMCVWIYYDADKKKIIDFATKHLFDGDKEAATNYVDFYYPLVITFLDIYKQF